MSGWIGAWGNSATVTNLTVTGSQLIAVNTSTDALRITQTGSGNALVVEDSANPDATPFAVDASGNVGIGVVPAFAGNKLSIAGAGTDASSWLARYSADASSYEMRLLKSRSTSIYAKSVVQSGDSLGFVSFGGDDGANFNIAASIAAAVDGTPGLNDMPGRLVFNTTPDGASSTTERMRIDNAGNIYGTSGTTAMTNGFFYIPSAAGAPSGVPTAVSGRVPMYYDTTNNNFYVYNGAWKKVLLG